MRKFLFISCVGLSILTSILLFVKINHIESAPISYDLSIDNMPLVEDDPFETMADGRVPIEQRGAEHRRWLAAGLKIHTSIASGSGTIVYYNPDDGWAYVHSCGHLWRRSTTAEEAKRRSATCHVSTWYHNDQKLDRSRKYPAEVLYCSNGRGRDISLMRFKPDWEPEYFPIAPDDFQFINDMRLHSVGCDGGQEVAHYDVRYIGMRDTGSGWGDLVTTENSPRPGRSGGGLMTNDYYVGICWGTSSYSGNGNGFFTPLSTIREYNKRNGYGWLNEAGISWARMIPIIDRNNPQGEYPRDYIPLPLKS